MMKKRHNVDAILMFVCLGLMLYACEAAMAAPPKNLLPNASFELGWGEGMQTHWLDYQNALTIKLTAKGQLPKAWPGVKARPDAPDGKHVAS